MKRAGVAVHLDDELRLRSREPPRSPHGDADERIGGDDDVGAERRAARGRPRAAGAGRSRSASGGSRTKRSSPVPVPGVQRRARRAPRRGRPTSSQPRLQRQGEPRAADEENRWASHARDAQRGSPRAARRSRHARSPRPRASSPPQAGRAGHRPPARGAGRRQGPPGRAEARAARCDRRSRPRGRHRPRSRRPESRPRAPRPRHAGGSPRRSEDGGARSCEGPEHLIARQRPSEPHATRKLPRRRAAFQSRPLRAVADDHERRALDVFQGVERTGSAFCSVSRPTKTNVPG